MPIRTRTRVAEVGAEGPCPEKSHFPIPPRFEDDADESLIRWMLGLTVTERMEVAQRFVDDVARLRPAGVRDDETGD